MVTNHDRLGAFKTLMEELARIDQIPAVRAFLPEYEQRIGALKDFYLLTPFCNGDGNLQFDMFWAPSESITPASLKIYPYFPEDAKLHSVLSKSGIVNGLSYAVYNRPNHQIFFNIFAKETLRFVASVFVHELGHALVSKRSGMALSKAEDPLEKRIAEEVVMRTFDYKFALAIGGPAYTELFEKGVYRTKKVRERDPMKTPKFAGTGTALDLCFGPPPTELGKHYRDSLFQLYCELANADRNMKGHQALRWKCHVARSVLAGLQE